jgi:hypothetical protein
VAAIGNGAAFRKGREFAAWLGLVPRQHSTGGEARLYGISKRGNTYLRRMFIHGARALLLRVKHDTGSLGQWVHRLEVRTTRNKVIVAVANKLARIAWAVLYRQQVYWFADVYPRLEDGPWKRHCAWKANTAFHFSTAAYVGLYWSCGRDKDNQKKRPDESFFPRPGRLKPNASRIGTAASQLHAAELGSSSSKTPLPVRGAPVLFFGRQRAAKSTSSIAVKATMRWEAARPSAVVHNIVITQSFGGGFPHGSAPFRYPLC